MKCRYCGQEIPEGKLYCDRCGEEVRIVPDYNPLDDMLTQQIRGAINGEEEDEEYPDYREIRSSGGRSAAHNAESGTGRNTKYHTGRGTGRSVGDNRNHASRNMSEQEKRRKRAQRKKAQKRKKMIRALIILGIILIVGIILGIVLYQTSYSGIIKKGNKALAAKEYDTAAEYFNKAVGKNEERADAYIGLSKIYISQDDLEQAEAVFLSVIEKQPKNAEIYDACVNFYLDTEQQAKIPLLLKNAVDSVRKQLEKYIVDEPGFSLDDSEVFDDVQELSFGMDSGCVVYYTTDGTEATMDSTKYSDPIQIGEGETTVTAIAVNQQGIPSLPLTMTYMVEFPIEDAPAVSPSTGQYSSAMQIEIKVPDGYDAYYTMNGTEPTTASTKYTGPISMPEGETLFKAVLINSKGRTSGVTTRNYVLDTE